jgi:hypothetical protein
MAVPGPTSSFTPQLEPAKPPTEIAPVGTSFMTIVATALRQQPDKSGKRLVVLTSETEVTIADSEASGDWYKINVPSLRLTGFVEAKTVRETSVLEAAEWQRIQKKWSDIRSLQSFLSKYPQGVHAKAVKVRLNELRRAEASAPSETLSSRRCTSIIERSQLGEEITDADRAILKNNCH